MGIKEAEELVFKYVDLINPELGKAPFARDASQLPTPLGVIRHAMLIYLEAICSRPNVAEVHLKAFCDTYSTLGTWVTPESAQLINEAESASHKTPHQQKLLADFTERLSASLSSVSELECVIQHYLGQRSYSEFTLSSGPPHASIIQTYEINQDLGRYTWTKYNYKGATLSRSGSDFTTLEDCLESIRLDGCYPCSEIRHA
jgi:hypothetical protein